MNTRLVQAPASRRSSRSALTGAASSQLPALSELLVAIHALDAEIRQTNSEIVEQLGHGAVPGVAVWVDEYWLPFVNHWNRGMREVYEYESGQGRGAPEVATVAMLFWGARSRYYGLRRDAGASWGFNLDTPLAVSGFFDDIGGAISSAARGVYGAAKGAVSSVASFVHHPPGWLAVAMPLFTMENQRYWSEKLGGSTGAKLYDAGVKIVASKALGPQGPQLVEAYNKVVEDAARGHLSARQILAKAPQIAKLAAASRRGPAAFKTAIAETGSAVKVSGGPWSAYNAGLMHSHQLFSGQDLVGFDAFGADALKDFRNVAIHAVTSAHDQRPSAVFGYVRSRQHQKVLLFGTINEARSWYDQRGHLEPVHDYAAVFVSTDLRTPVLEALDGGIAAGDAATVGHWFLPLALGLPLGAVGGYFYRQWQEKHPGQIVPGLPGSGPPAAVSGGSWLDVVGALPDADVARRRAWPQTRALIQSAIRDTRDVEFPWHKAFVWQLSSWGTAGAVPFDSYERALAYMRHRLQASDDLDPPVAIAVFDKGSRHWPNPVNWSKSDDPAFEPVIAQQITKHLSTVAGEVVGGGPWQDIVGGGPWQDIVGGGPWQDIVGGGPWQDIVGGGPWQTIVGGEIEGLRRQAKVAAEGWMEAKGGRSACVVGVLLTGRRQPTFMAFSSDDLAEEWFEQVTGNPSSFVYAAYFDTKAPFAPVQLAEAAGGRARYL